MPKRNVLFLSAYSAPISFDLSSLICNQVNYLLMEHLSECTFTARVGGDPVASSTVAMVEFIAALQEIPVLGQAGLGLLVLLLGWLGLRRMRAGENTHISQR